MNSRSGFMRKGSREHDQSYPLGAGWAEHDHGVAGAGAMTWYSRCLAVDDGDDTWAPSVSEWKRGEGVGACEMGQVTAMGQPIAEGRKREEGGLLLLRAKKGRER